MLYSRYREGFSLLLEGEWGAHVVAGVAALYCTLIERPRSITLAETTEGDNIVRLTTDRAKEV